MKTGKAPGAIRIKFHPEAIYDEPFKTETLDVSGYKPVAGPLRMSRRDHALCATGGGVSMLVQAAASNMVRIRVKPGTGDFEPSVTERLGLVQAPEWNGGLSVRKGGGKLRLVFGEMEVSLDLGTALFSVSGPGGEKLVACAPSGIRFSPEPGEYGGNRFLASFKLGDEQVFGFGGRSARPNRTGRTADIYAVKVGSHSGDYGGFPVPFFMSSKGYGVFLNNPWPHVYFDMGATNPGEWFVHAPGGEFDLFVIRGPEFPRIVSTFTALTGRMPEPERWWLGFWTSTIAFNTAAQVKNHVGLMRRDRCPHDAIVLDGPWRGGPDFFDRYKATGQYESRDIDWHPAFGGGPEFVKWLSRRGLKLGLHLNSRSFGRETADKALAEGLLRQHGEEIVPKVADPAGEAWFRKQLAGRNAEGVGLWWLDHGDRVSGEISPGVPSRNLFGALWARAVVGAGADGKTPAKICLIRGCGIGGQRYGLPWPGDTRYGVEFFDEDIWFCINAGLSGFPMTSFDLGGFFGANPQAAFDNDAHDRDNLARRVCHSLMFSPTLRAHCNGLMPMKIPANCPPPIHRLYHELLGLRYRLTPYFYSCAVHAHRTGEPIVRPLVYHHRTDPDTHDIDDQVYVGEWLMVAPVTVKNALHRNVYLPEGEWIDYWTDEVLRGGRMIRVETPFYEKRGVPVFVKAGAIIPMQDPTLQLGDRTPGHLTLDVYPGRSSEFTLWDSAEVRSIFRCRSGKAGVSLDIEQAEAVRRPLTIRIHNHAAGRHISINGKTAAGVHLEPPRIATVK